MTLQDLQKQIYNGGITNSYLVFVCDKPKGRDSVEKPMDTFLAYQYANAIAKTKKLEIQIIDDVESLFTDCVDIFDEEIHNNYLRVYRSEEEFKCDNIKLNEQTNLIIIVPGFANDAVKDNCKQNTIKMPKLDSWQIKDYLYSTLKGVQKEKLDWLQNVCGNDIHRLQQEIDKLNIFDEGERDKLFDTFFKDGVYQDLSDSNVFSLSNALTRRDIHAIKTYYPEVMKSKDFSEMGFLVIVLNAFKNFVSVKLHPNPTEESIGLKKNQIYAISKTGTGFTSNLLLEAYRFLSDIDRQIKTGEMWMDILVDYIIVKLLSLKEE